MQPHQLGAALHAHHHRRNPSAPTLSIQPTNVPGLFSLGSRNATQTAKAAREPKQPKQQQTQQQQQQRNKDAAPATPEAAKTAGKAVAVDSAAAVTAPTSPTPASPAQDKHQRGRKPANAPPRPKRSPSQQEAQARRHKEHQPDPEPIAAEQARATSPSKEQTQPSPRKQQQRPTHQRNNTAPTSPTVSAAVPASATSPAAKIARRRNRVKSGVAPTTPEDELATATVPITTPASKNVSKQHLSRSAPLAVADWDTPLSIDIKSIDAPLASGPRTAPLDKAARFPLGASYSPPASPTPNRHGRSPSVPINGIFDMEDDLHMPHSKSAGSSPSIPMARRFKAPGQIHQFGGSMSSSATVPMFSLLNSAANISAPGDLDHPSVDPRFKWASSSFQTGPATRVLPAPGL